MHPDLLNNSLFLRYYRQWQHNPSSVVFTSIADFFLRVGFTEQALVVCREGLKYHPKLVTGRLVLAKALRAQGEIDEARAEVEKILEEQPDHRAATFLLSQLEVVGQRQEAEAEGSLPEGLRTITMAKIFHAQGHCKRAREIYTSILKLDPHNEAAREALKNDDCSQ